MGIAGLGRELKIAQGNVAADLQHSKSLVSWSGVSGETLTQVQLFLQNFTSQTLTKFSSQFSSLTTSYLYVLHSGLSLPLTLSSSPSLPSLLPVGRFCDPSSLTRAIYVTLRLEQRGEDPCGPQWMMHHRKPLTPFFPNLLVGNSSAVRVGVGPPCSQPARCGY